MVVFQAVVRLQRWGILWKEGMFSCSPLEPSMKLVLVLALAAGAVWLGLRIWKKRRDSH